MAIKLTVRYSTTTENSRLQAYGLKVEVLAAEDMPEEVFVFQRRVPSATDAEANEQPDEFQSLADPVDLEQYPTNAPDLANDMPYYRLSVVELFFRSTEELAEVYELLDTDFRRLVYSLKVLDELEPTEDVVYE